MGSKIRKRERDPVQNEHSEEAPPKRRRQINEDHLKLAKQLIVKFSPENKPAAKEVEVALNRLIKGLCSQRKAARVGFSLTLTELLRQLFGQTDNAVEGLDLDVASIIKMVEEKTEIEGNVPGRVWSAIP
jgi:DNA polymerase phi